MSSIPSNPFPEPILRLSKCIIRPYDNRDAESLSKAANNDKIAKWLTNMFPHPYEIENARQWINTATSQLPRRNYAICTLDGATVMGGIGVKTRDDIYHRTMEVGYWLGEDHWGQGITTEATGAFCGWVFETFDQILRLEAEVFEGNIGSARVLEKVGFEREARLKKAIEKWGVVQDVFIFCKVRDGC